MPGILPMKVIKVGSSAQSRIAQACDRCRSKKIRCDGIRPCCSQCANVGFECKTSDKLSRRAFPRGYTESLEERVRSLEAEVRDLKNLLDEKDEKIDMLSKMHSNRRPSIRSSVSPAAEMRKISLSPSREDMFRVQASPLLLDAEKCDSYFMGASSGRAFIDAFKRKIQESGKSSSALNTDTFLNLQNFNVPSPSCSSTSTIPPRLFSDRCVNVFFQEWAPLFPVLHRPTFLHQYEQYVSKPEVMSDNHQLAQLHLVFAIAGLSSSHQDHESIALCERQWILSLDAIIMDNKLATLQCLVLAILYCTVKADYKKLQHYKAIAVGLSHRLGLHQSQKRFSFGALTIETRKKVFWTLYTIDCFSAASLGLPKLLKETDIHTEYPMDVDDEYVTEKGFQPTLPGEFTRISSALALFRGSRVLSKVLDENYPSATSHDLSLQSIAGLDSDLSEWYENLPSRMRLTFAQDKPSTDVTGNRSSFLTLMYYYVRTLIHRPAVGSSLGAKASSSLISLADSSKHIIQIVQLLEERSMSFSFCLNRNEIVALCGLSILYHGLDLKEEGRLMKDCQRLVGDVMILLEEVKAPVASDFSRLAASVTKLRTPPRLARQQSDEVRSAPAGSARPTPSPSQSNKAAPSRGSRYSFSTGCPDSELLHMQEKLRRATLPTQGLSIPSNQSSSSLDSPSSHPSAHRASVPALHMMAKPPMPSPMNTTRRKPNLDYLSFNNTPAQSQPASPRMKNNMPHQPHQPHQPTGTAAKHSSVSQSEWDSIIVALDGGQPSIYDALYSSAPPITSTSSSPPGVHDVHLESHIDSHSHNNNAYDDWSSAAESWDITALNMLHSLPGNDGLSYGAMPVAHTARSVFSEESLSSGGTGSEDFTTGSEMGRSSISEGFWGKGGGNSARMASAAGANADDAESFILGALNGNFAL